MQEILFRGKRLDNGEWIISGSIRQWKNGNVGLMTEYGMYKVDPVTVGQNTNLIDCNGKNIFEGDIVEFETTKRKYKGRVGSDKGCWCIRIGFEWVYLHQAIEFHQAKIIGNIHDNIELEVE